MTLSKGECFPFGNFSHLITITPQRDIVKNYKPIL